MAMHDNDDATKLLTAEDVGEFLGLSARTVLHLPIRQIRLGPRTIRFRWRDVDDYIARENSKDV